MTQLGDRVFLKSPDRTEVLVYWSQYGALSGARANSRSRVWLIAETTDPDSALKVIIGTNNEQTGHVDYETLDVASATIRSAFIATIEIVLADGSVIGQKVAPCVCGAGAVGYAGPTTDRHYITMLTPGNHHRIMTP